MLSARAASVWLLRVGTLPFIAFLLASLVLPYDATVHKVLVCHAAIILAFIGGLQQAAVISGLPNATWAAIAAILCHPSNRFTAGLDVQDIRTTRRESWEAYAQGV